VVPEYVGAVHSWTLPGIEHRFDLRRRRAALGATRALEPGPTHGAYESAALARIVSWASPEDCAALTWLVRKARRDAFEVGRLNAQAEAEGGTE
jgi:hypothetical protein